MMLRSVFILIVWCSSGDAFFDKIFNSERKAPDIGEFLNKFNPLNIIFKTKCIEDLGCFYNGPPFYDPILRPISLTPTDNLKIHFILFIPTNQEEGHELDTTQKSVKDSPFDSKYPLKVLIHGFETDFKEKDAVFRIKDALLNWSKYNVIIVDWTENSAPPYPQAVANARAVAAKLAKLLNVIMKSTGITAQDVHLIGHSLGGHICGWTGERIQNLGRITGLDPAGPYFRRAPKEVRLDHTNALFVDVIHTNRGDNFLQGLGINEPIGHMNFYPNGGSSQPGCGRTGDSEHAIISGFINSTFAMFSKDCSHMRANDYFLESIDNSKCRFLATLCNSFKGFEKGDCLPKASTVTEMGFHAKRIEGVPVMSKFYLRTNDKSPFCNENSIYLKNK